MGKMHGAAIFQFGEFGWHAQSNAMGVACVIRLTTPFGVPQGVPPNLKNGDSVAEDAARILGT